MFPFSPSPSFLYALRAYPSSSSIPVFLLIQTLCAGISLPSTTRFALSVLLIAEKV